MAYEALEDLEVFQMAERICDRFYEVIQPWSLLDKETVGVQLIRAADSIGANIAESYGRYHEATVDYASSTVEDEETFLSAHEVDFSTGQSPNNQSPNPIF